MVVVVNDPATTEIYTYGHTLSLHDALPISEIWVSRSGNPRRKLAHTWELARAAGGLVGINTGHPNALVEEAIARDAIPELAGYPARRREVRSEEHTSELQSLMRISYAVFCLKKKTPTQRTPTNYIRH